MDEHASYLHYQRGMIMKSRGKYQNAFNDFYHAKWILESLMTGKVEYKLLIFSIAECSTQMASSLGALGKFKRAEEQFESAIADIERAHGKDHELIGAILNEMAITQKNSGKYAQSLQSYNRALRIFELSGGYERLIAIIKTNLSLVHIQMGNYELAVDCNREALKLKQHGFDDQSISINHNTQGYIFQRMGQYDDALKCYRSAIEMKNRSPKINRLSLAQSYSNIAEIYAHESEYRKALNYITISKTIREEIVGRHHYLSIESHEDQLALETTPHPL